MNNLTGQQLKEILNPNRSNSVTSNTRFAREGCGKFGLCWSFTDGKPFVDIKCGFKFHGELYLCHKCSLAKAIQKAKKETLLMCAKNELEFLENLISNIFEWYGFTEERMNMCEKDSIKKIKERISQLQEVIKKLE